MSTKDRLYVVGPNEYYQFGLGHKKKVKELTEWTDENESIAINQIKISLAGLIVIDTDGHQWSMGCNQHGECAIRDKDIKYVVRPTEIKFFRRKNIGIKTIFANTNGWAVFWLTNNNEVYGNGYNESHQLGVGDQENHFRPIRVELKNIIKVSSADRYSLALDSSGRVFSTPHSEYGGNVHGKYKNDGNYGWKRIMDGIKVIDIGNGDEHSLFLSANGVVYGVGRGDHERLGNGLRGETRVVSPVPYFELHKVWIKKIACGRSHNLAIDDNDNVWSWGCNFVGQCGDYTFSICTPNLITSLKEERIIDIKCGTEHSYVRTATDQHYLFGSNMYNECSLMDVGATSISLPYVINHIIKNKANGVIKEVHLGKNSTVIIVRDQDEDQDAAVPDQSADKDKGTKTVNVQGVDVNTTAKILELCEMLSVHERDIAKKIKEISDKDKEIATLNDKLKEMDKKYMKTVESVKEEQKKKKEEIDNELQRIGALRKEMEKERERQSKTTKDTTKSSKDDKKQGDVHVDCVKLLKEWKLQKYKKVLIDEMGYDVIGDWKELTMDELKDEMDFKPGHAKRFLKNIEKYSKQKK